MYFVQKRPSEAWLSSNTITKKKNQNLKMANSDLTGLNFGGPNYGES